MDSEIKECTQCKKSKPLSDFSKAKVKGKMYHRGYCKICTSRNASKKARTIYGHITAMYAHKRSSSKKRNHPMPNYSKEEFEHFLALNNYKEMYEHWKESSFDRKLTPSCDRLDDNLPYTLCNIQLTTWEVNNKGPRKMLHKRVIQYDLNENYIAEFESITKAASETNSLISKISLCCNGKRNNHNGFVWKVA